MFEGLCMYVCVGHPVLGIFYSEFMSRYRKSLRKRSLLTDFNLIVSKMSLKVRISLLESVQL